MNITMEQEGNYMSLFDFLGKPAGMELGREVCNEAIRRKVDIGKREISNKAYKSRDDFELLLKSQPIKNKTILLKGSRGISLEKLTKYL